MRTRFALAALAAATLSTFAAAQMGPGTGQGMMHGRGMGPGMGQQQDCPMGQGMGPGAMQGKGMMHGRGGHGMRGGGGGMMGGPGLAALEALNLTDEQRAKLTEIRRDAQRKRHSVMGGMHELRWKAQDAAKAPELDVAAARKLYDERAALRKQLFEVQLEARAKAEALLTKEQREQLRAQPRPMRPGPRA